MGSATRQKTPISRSALDKNAMPGHPFEGNHVDEGTTQRVTDTLCIVRKIPQVPHTAGQVACHPVTNSRGRRSSIPPHNTSPDSPVPTLQGPWDWSQKWRGTVRFFPQLQMRPSSIARNPVASGNLQTQHHSIPDFSEAP